MKKQSFKGTLGEYHWRETDDGSHTLYSEYFDENCHSTAGATAETLYNYVEGCECAQFLENQGRVHIFEVGFGTGIGLTASLAYLNRKEGHISFTSCELDRELTRMSLESLIKSQEIDAFSWDEEYQIYKGTSGNCNFQIIVGDIRERIQVWAHSPYYQRIDALYQDAFSPKRSPSLWTHQWFSELAKHSHEATVMGTYSSTKAVWKAMVKAGWVVKMVPGYGLKKISTRAYRQGIMSQEILDLMERSPIEALSD